MSEQPHPPEPSAESSDRSTHPVIAIASELLSMCSTPMAQLDRSTSRVLWCNSGFDELCQVVGLGDASIGLRLLQQSLLHSSPGANQVHTSTHGVLTCYSRVVGHDGQRVVLWVFEKEASPSSPLQSPAPPESVHPESPRALAVQAETKLPDAQDFPDPDTKVYSAASDGTGGPRSNRAVVTLWHKYGQSKRPTPTGCWLGLLLLTVAVVCSWSNNTIDASTSPAKRGLGSTSTLSPPTRGR